MSAHKETLGDAEIPLLTLKHCFQSLWTAEQRNELWKSHDRLLGLTAVHMATSRGNIDTIKYMLDCVPYDQQFELLKREWHGRTPLHWVAYYGHQEIIQHILDNVEKKKKYELLAVRSRCDGTTALHWAAARGNANVFRFIMTRLAPAQQVRLLRILDKKGEIELDWAVRGNQEEVIVCVREMHSQSAERLPCGTEVQGV